MHYQMSNLMREIRIEKLTLNIGVGTAADKIDKAKKLLETITGEKPVSTITQKRIPGWGVRPGLNIGVKITLRGKKAKELLKRLLVAVDNTLEPSCFDKEGNFGFGIPEYVDIPNMEYLVEIGIMGLEVAITLERPGFRIKKRKYLKKRIPKKHRITAEESMEYLQKEFDVKIGERD